MVVKVAPQSFVTRISKVSSGRFVLPGKLIPGEYDMSKLRKIESVADGCDNTGDMNLSEFEEPPYWNPLTKADATPDRAAVVVRAQVIFASGLITAQPVGGNVVASKVSVNETGIVGLTKKLFLTVSFDLLESPVPLAVTGSEVYTIKVC